MVLGVGTDILKTDRLHEASLRPDDPFLLATYSQAELAQAAAHQDRHSYLAARFCGKEAVFKSLGISGEHVRFSEIEILSDENGRPRVYLSGNIAAAAANRGIGEVLVSLSCDGAYVQAFAIAQATGMIIGKETT